MLALSTFIYCPLYTIISSRKGEGGGEGGKARVECPINKRGAERINVRSTFTLLIEIIEVTRCSAYRISGSHGIHLLDKCTYTYVYVCLFHARARVCVCLCVCVCIYIIYNLCTRTTVTITTTAIMITTDDLRISLLLDTVNGNREPRDAQRPRLRIPVRSSISPITD